MKKKIRKTRKQKAKKVSSKKPKKLAHEILYKNLEWATETAAYYGFSPYHLPEVTKGARQQAEKTEKDEREDAQGDLPFLHLAERISILRDYEERKRNKEHQPILAAYTSKKGESKTYHFGLEILGSET